MPDPDLDLSQRRRFFAEEIAMAAGLRTRALVDAFATIPREKFLRPGPWTVRGDGEMFAAQPRQTPDADPRHVYHNVVVGIDPARMLFNGSPSLLGGVIDALTLEAGHRVLHVGSGLGYYTAVIAHVVGAAGRVVAIEVDETLAAEARANLASMPWVDVRCGHGTDQYDERFDAILVNAGVTHPRDEWLDALAVGGRMMLPLTASLPQMATIGKGFMLLVTRESEGSYLVKPATIVAIYSAIGLRDDALNAALGEALRTHPFPPVKRLRRDPHERDASCWLHAATCCLSTV